MVTYALNNKYDNDFIFIEILVAKDYLGLILNLENDL